MWIWKGGCILALAGHSAGRQDAPCFWKVFLSRHMLALGEAG